MYNLYSIHKFGVLYAKQFFYSHVISLKLILLSPRTGVSPPFLTDRQTIHFSTQARKMRASIKLKHAKYVHEHGNFALLSLYPYEHPLSGILELAYSYINQR